MRRRPLTPGTTAEARYPMEHTVFSPALSHFGATERERKAVFAFRTQGTATIIGKWLEDHCRDDIEMILDLAARHTTASRQVEP